MEWIARNNFMLSLSFLGGAQFVSYPFDSVKRDPLSPHVEIPGPHKTPDDPMFVNLATNYVNQVNQKKTTSNWYCPSLQQTFENGIVNGAAWSPASGNFDG